MDRDKFSYTFKWTQPYSEFQLMQEAIAEMRVENSDMEDAKAVLKHIMEMK